MPAILSQGFLFFSPVPAKNASVPPKIMPQPILSHIFQFFISP
jgi:hypothetical protein